MSLYYIFIYNKTKLLTYLEWTILFVIVTSLRVRSHTATAIAMSQVVAITIANVGIKAILMTFRNVNGPIEMLWIHIWECCFCNLCMWTSPNKWVSLSSLDTEQRNAPKKKSEKQTQSLTVDGLLPSSSLNVFGFIFWPGINWNIYYFLSGYPYLIGWVETNSRPVIIICTGRYTEAVAMETLFQTRTVNV